MPSLRNWRKKRVTKSDDKKVPALRFKGFTDDWEQRKLGEVLLVNSGKDYKNLNKGNIPVYGTGGYMLSVNRALSNENAIGIGRKGTIDRPQYLIAPFWTVDTLFFLTVKNQNDLKFFYALFQKINWKKYDESTGLPSLSKSTLNNIFLKNPNYKEQKKIGLLLSQIEVLITLQQRKLEQLNLLQRALLQRIFANRNLQPDLRFTNFSGAWEQHKLGNMANILRGASPRPIKDKKWFDTNSRIGWIRISDVTSQNGRVYTLGQHLSKKGQEKTHVVSSQTLLLSIAASVGYPVITYVETGVHDGFIIFDKPKFNLDFMFFKLQSIQNIWSKYGQPGSQVNINSSIVANTSISIPNIKEQKKISILLKKIEENIHLQQNKINKLQELKRSFLQNMFI